ncbi:hypothetical protein [Peribacillus asahii]|uniref:hypothetical protein n=1 Tax=Peribacillus asahii TaxID=228899 RepID=UPI00207A4FA2|nr:hypothetical protein [Peribacillus asahii]USK62192.1 hypothetical protein LIT37_23740 [Peribacillus asahii]
MLNNAMPIQQKSGIISKIILSMLLVLGISFFVNPISDSHHAFAEEGKASTGSISSSDAYGGGNTKINDAVKEVIKIVGGVGGLLFTLAILVIAVVIIFGSISAAKMRTVWISLISCCAGALIFYSAYFLSGVIADLAV